MDTDITRRALVGAILGGSAVGGSLSPVRSYLRRFAPLSGTACDGATDCTDRRVESPYGAAKLRYDEDDVPNITADDEWALYFAVGYAQARDRLFQLERQVRASGVGRELLPPRLGVGPLPGETVVRERGQERGDGSRPPDGPKADRGGGVRDVR
ncbi:penicillin acylase family protein [Haladaptatus halobius]|uniref:penicillin acylase family protein n=1 Tax=Haladaptatus halobius TaxID=2884875 RepID=UPI001D0BC6E9|nr:penicillin acylase family protein [Haladaptatus halobius]